MFEFFNEIELYHAVFFALFSMGLAIFHTVILTALFGLQFKSWLFFVLNPLLILTSYFIYPPLSGFIFIFLVASVFLLGLVGMIFRMISDAVQNIKEKNSAKNKPTPWWQIVLGLAGGAIIFVSFIYVGVVGFFVLIIIIIVLSKILPNSENRFFRLQGILPTAPIRSIPMGLIEVSGKVKYMESLVAPMKSKRCAGYRYIVEKISTDSDGDRRYTTITDEMKCNQFILYDETGEVKVRGDGLDLLYLDMDERYSSGSKRYTQYLLKEGDEVLLIGKVENNGSDNIITKESLKKIFALAPLAAVTKYNAYKPLLRSLATMAVVLACLIAFVLLADISVSGNTVVIGWNSRMNLL
ncbi:MAG: hypothetical protein LBV74_18140 [Tannerella sp.]|jgi:hypothetical protein|nr:hypothetical protein [Tannerella sp.]